MDSGIAQVWNTQEARRVSNDSHVQGTSQTDDETVVESVEVSAVDDGDADINSDHYTDVLLNSLSSQDTQVSKKTSSNVACL